MREVFEEATHTRSVVVIGVPARESPAAPTHGAGLNDWDPTELGCVCGEELRGQVVRAFDDEVDAFEERLGVLGDEARFMNVDLRAE